MLFFFFKDLIYFSPNFLIYFYPLVVCDVRSDTIFKLTFSHLFFQMGNIERHFEEGEFLYNSDESTFFVQACLNVLSKKNTIKRRWLMLKMQKNGWKRLNLCLIFEL